MSNSIVSYFFVHFVSLQGERGFQGEKGEVVSMEE